MSASWSASTATSRRAAGKWSSSASTRRSSAGNSSGWRACVPSATPRPRPARSRRCEALPKAPVTCSFPCVRRSGHSARSAGSAASFAPSSGPTTRSAPQHQARSDRSHSAPPCSSRSSRWRHPAATVSVSCGSPKLPAGRRTHPPGEVHRLPPGRGHRTVLAGDRQAGAEVGGRDRRRGEDEADASVAARRGLSRLRGRGGAPAHRAGALDASRPGEGRRQGDRAGSRKGADVQARGAFRRAPDQRSTMPSAYTPMAKAGATDDYRCFLLDPKLRGGRVRDTGRYRSRSAGDRPPRDPLLDSGGVGARLPGKLDAAERARAGRASEESGSSRRAERRGVRATGIRRRRWRALADRADASRRAGQGAAGRLPGAAGRARGPRSHRPHHRTAGHEQLAGARRRELHAAADRPLLGARQPRA